MADFFRTNDGRFRGLRFAACLYVLNSLMSLVRVGWRLIPSVPWLVAALVFFAYSLFAEGPNSRYSKLTYYVGSAATFVGLAVLAYSITVD